MAVRLTDITKSFGENSVLRGVDLQLHSGQVTVLMGANCAGKSTLVKVLCGVYPANSGTVKPNAFGTIICALFIGILLQGLTLMIAPYYTQDFVKGAVLVVTLVFAFALSRRGGAHWLKTQTTKESETTKGRITMKMTRRILMKMADSAAVMTAGLSSVFVDQDPSHNVVVPPTLITQPFLNDNDIKNMDDLSANMPQFAHADVSVPDWMPLPAR